MNKYIGPETQEWRQENVTNKWPHINEVISLGKLLTVKNATEHRNLGTLSYKIKCKWENQAKKAEKRLVGGQE